MKAYKRITNDANTLIEYIACLCMADVVGNAPGHDCANWRRSIRAAHFRNALYQNYHTGPDYHPLPNAFAHGTTQLFAGQTAAATFASLIAGVRFSTTSVRNHVSELRAQK